MSINRYASSKSFECSCGGHDVQLPGVEKVTPAMIRPASTFAPISTLRSLSAGGLPAIKWRRGFSRTSLYETNLSSYRFATGAETSARRSEERRVGKECEEQ